MRVSHWGPVQVSGSYKAENIAGATEVGATAPSSYSSKPTQWKPAYPGTYTTLSQERCLQRSFPWGSTSQSSFGFLQSEAVSRCPMSPTKTTNLGCTVFRNPARQERTTSSSFLSHWWYLHDTSVEAPWERCKMSHSANDPGTVPTQLLLLLTLAPTKEREALHGAGSMGS